MIRHIFYLNNDFTAPEALLQLENYFNLFIGSKNDAERSGLLNFGIINLLKNTNSKDLKIIL